jgi:hypothetical protein
MKSIQECESEIKKLTQSIQKWKSTPLQERKARLKILFIRKCILYLELKPKPEFIASEIERIRLLIRNITPGFDPRITKKTISKNLKELGIKNMEKQLKTLLYLNS